MPGRRREGHFIHVAEPGLVSGHRSAGIVEQDDLHFGGICLLNRCIARSTGRCLQGWFVRHFLQRVKSDSGFTLPLDRCRGVKSFYSSATLRRQLSKTLQLFSPFLKGIRFIQPFSTIAKPALRPTQLSPSTFLVMEKFDTDLEGSSVCEHFDFLFLSIWRSDSWMRATLHRVALGYFLCNVYFRKLHFLLISGQRVYF